MSNYSLLSLSEGLVHGRFDCYTKELKTHIHKKRGLLHIWMGIFLTTKNRKAYFPLDSAIIGSAKNVTLARPHSPSYTYVLLMCYLFNTIVKFSYKMGQKNAIRNFPLLPSHVFRKQRKFSLIPQRIFMWHLFCLTQ
jgi:hypothetical protein